MRVTSQPGEGRVVVQLENDAEEASYVYDLVQSGRLQVENKDTLPLPFRGQFLFKLPDRPRPIPIQAAHVAPSATDVLAGNAGPRLIFSCAKGHPDLVAELERALRDVPPASEEEFKSAAAEREDEFTRVRNMPFAKKVIYATRAGQTGRTILLQQPNPILMLYLCKNPMITLPELIQIAKMPSIDALVAEYINKMLHSNPQWAQSEELKLALASNAKTPVGAALGLLTHLSSRSLSAICKVPEVRGILRQAALKLLQDR